MAKPKFESVTLSNGTPAKVAQVSAELISINENDVYENKNGTQYRLCTIKFDNGGKILTPGAMMYESNYQKGVTVGSHYLAEITLTADNDPLFICSALSQRQSVSNSDFDVEVTTADFSEAGK
jgi:hypothetical protein